MKKQKLYSKQEEAPGEVSEPISNYGDTYGAVLKMKAVEEIMKLEEVDLLDKAVRFLHELRAEKKQLTGPCQFTINELKKEIEEAEEDVRRGKTHSIEELRNRHPLC
ncbi:MAG: hypothetical protein H6Q13_2747 [Bacteroidetes bacterium]|jgi:hypothetical protein|nr:hypothetical protein [Bacteroidota bacterium]